MKRHRIIFTAAVLFVTGALTAGAQPSNVVATAPIYVPDTSHANEPLRDGILAWDADQKTLDATNGQDFARFTFSFTNITATLTTALATNVTDHTNITALTNASFWGKEISRTTNFFSTTNVTTVTNLATFPVTVLSVHPSCGCTTAELPPVPWIIPAGASGEIKLNVNLAGKAGIVFKTANVATDQGNKNLTLHINIAPPPPPRTMTETERAVGVAAAKVDRQAVFKGDCASCHVPKDLSGKYGQPLFDAVCAICHEANPRASMVPDLHNLPVTTSEEFWRTWITAGKAGTLMPAFATSQGGPLSDMQVVNLAAYLNGAMPPHAPTPTATNAPAAK